MSYTDDAVLAKLSALNETQESIVSAVSFFQMLFGMLTAGRLLLLNGLYSTGKQTANNTHHLMTVLMFSQETCRTNWTALATAPQGLEQFQETGSDLPRKWYFLPTTYHQDTVEGSKVSPK